MANCQLRFCGLSPAKAKGPASPIQGSPSPQRGSDGDGKPRCSCRWAWLGQAAFRAVNSELRHRLRGAQPHQPRYYQRRAQQDPFCYPISEHVRLECARKNRVGDRRQPRALIFVIEQATKIRQTHHARHAFSRTIGWPVLQLHAFWNSGMFCTTPFTRKRPGECGFVCTCSRTASGR